MAGGLTTRADVTVLADIARDLVGIALRSIALESVSAPQFRLMLQLSEDGPMASSHAARLLDVAPSSITRLTARLVEAGLIARGSNPAHRGVVLLGLTTAGAELVDRVLERRHAELAAVLDAIDPRLRDACLAGLTAMRAQLPKDRSIGGIW